MSTATLTNLRDYLFGTLSMENMRWLAEQLNQYANKEEENYTLKRYTKDEINAMLDQSEAEIAAGKGTPNDEVMQEWDEEISRIEEHQETNQENVQTGRLRA